MDEAKRNLFRKITSYFWYTSDKSVERTGLIYCAETLSLLFILMAKNTSVGVKMRHWSDSSQRLCNKRERYKHIYIY